MIRIILSCLLFFMSVSAYAQDGGEGVGGGTGVSGQRLPKGCPLGIATDARGVASCVVTPATATPAEIINITDYGAVCDGVTDDTVAINLAFAAARSSPMYTGGGGVVNVVGVADATHTACAVHSVNASGFIQGQPRQEVLVTNLSLICSGAGNICLDMTGSLYMQLRNVEILGDTSDPPEIGIQNGGIIAGIGACCIGSMINVQAAGSFTLAAYYSDAAETMATYSSRFSNTGTTTAPIRYVGTITPGSGYLDGFYNRVPLTGGNGNGAVAKVWVQGGIVTLVDVGDQTASDCPGCYQGKDYQVGDVLSADDADLGGGGGSGFSVPVDSVAPYGAILDGLNHWRHQSIYQDTSVIPVDTYFSFTYVTFFGGAFAVGGNGTTIKGAPLWVGGPRAFILDNVYLQNYQNVGSWCVEIYDGAVNIEQTYRSGCEVGSTLHSYFRITGPNSGPELVNFTMTTAGNSTGMPYIFSTAPNIIGVIMRNANINIGLANPAVVFESPQLFTVSGIANINRAELWNAPLSFSGTLCTGAPPTPVPFGTGTIFLFDQTKGTCAIPNGNMANLAPLDIQNSAVAAWSCARRLIATYRGALCELERASDSATAAIYANGVGDLDQSAAAVFCATTTCTVRTMYDQSGNANDAIQTVLANQPTFVLSDTRINNHADVLFGELATTGLVVASSATIDNIWAEGGYVNIFYSRVGGPLLDRLLYKASAVFPATGTGWEFSNDRSFHGGLSLVQLADTTDGQWEIGGQSFNPQLYELQYNSSSLANVPTMSSNGVEKPLVTTVQPTGTIGSDAGTNLIIGNNALLNRGADGAMAEILIYKNSTAVALSYITIPNAARREAIRRNQAIYYGKGNVID